ncbi:19729_t:CDS:2, partial [Funneliformis geosporum]
SADIKTTMMTIPLRNHVSDEDAKNFCQEISKLTLAEVIEQMTVREQIIRKQVGSGSTETIRKKKYTIRMEFYPKHEYKEEFNILSLTQKSKELRNETFDENAPIRNVGGDESDDGDQMFKNSTYDAPDENDLEDFETTFEDENNNNEHPNALNVENEHDKSTPSTSSRRQRNNRVVNGLKDRYVTNYLFDNENGNWYEIELQFPPETKILLLLGMAKSASKKAVIHEIHGISKCYPIENETHDDASKIVATEGVNIYSNDIAVILNTYGVKAARTAILKEVSGVLLYNATFHGDTDLLDSLSVRLVLGKVIQGGTGSFDVRVPFESIPKIS